MICPACLAPMVQKDKIGGGESDDNHYMTWMLLECELCGRQVKERYEVIVVIKGEQKGGNYATS